MFAFDKSLHANEDWWKDGTKKYQAHKWMPFTGEKEMQRDNRV